MNTNTWNRVRYRVYAPFYNWVADAFNAQRQKSIGLLSLPAGSRVLLVGAGTGIDLDFLPEGIHITAIDLTPAMIDRLQKRAQKQAISVDARVMDGQNLEFANETFDAVVLHLILAVIPDAQACIQEAVRVVKKGGQVVIFDKFLPVNHQPTLGRKLLNVVTNFLFTDINRQLEPLLASVPVRIIGEIDTGNFKKLGYRTVLVKKGEE